MWEWLERWQRRQRDLQEGADADLVRDNRRRWKICWWLMGCSFILIGIQAVVKFSDPWHTIAVTVTMVCLVGGVLFGHWARAEKSFLERPNPKEPPRLWK
jgi:hypothetical protein